jgi:anti-sigma B factor antagonist
MEELETDETSLAVEQSRDADGSPVVRLSGELDISNAHTLRETMEAVVGTSPSRLVFDLSELAFMDSSGIAVMVYAANNVPTVELRHASSIVRRVVEATGLAEILRLDP